MPLVDTTPQTHYMGCEWDHPECARVLAERVFRQVITEEDGSQWVPLEPAIKIGLTARYVADRLEEIRELALTTRARYDLPMSYIYNMLTRIIEATEIVAKAEVPHG